MRMGSNGKKGEDRPVTDRLRDIKTKAIRTKALAKRAKMMGAEARARRFKGGDLPARPARRFTRFTGAIAALAVFGLLLGSGVLAYNYDYLYYGDRTNTTASTPSYLIGGQEVPITVTTTDKAGDPRPDETVTITLVTDNPRTVYTLYEGKTDSHGVAQPSIVIPEHPGTAKLIIESDDERVENQIFVYNRSASPRTKILISTDKPLYQPGQTVHIRTLAFTGTELEASMAIVKVEVRDPDDNYIFRNEYQPNEYGVAYLDFPLSDQLPTGQYVIKVSLEDDIFSELPITVKNYVLPKFSINIDGSRQWYTFNDAIYGIINATYMFGKEVDGAVQISAYDDVGYSDYWYDDWYGEEEKGGEPDRNLLWQTDGRLQDGKFEFTIPPEKHSADYSGSYRKGCYYSYYYFTRDITLNVSITDTSGHTETKVFPLTLASDPFNLIVMGESNMKGETSTYATLVSYPDGIPVDGATVTFKYKDQTVKADTDARGVAYLTFVYNGEGEGTFTAKKGNSTVEQDYYLWGNSAMKLYPSQRSFGVGDKATFDVKYKPGSSVIDSSSSIAFFDVISDGMIVKSGTFELINDDIGSFSFTVTEDMFPLSEVRAYKMMKSRAAYDSVIIAVEGSTDLRVDVLPDSDTYRPGGTADIRFRVTDPMTGDRAPSILGVNIVDMSVYELEGRLMSTEDVFHGLRQSYDHPELEVIEYMFVEDRAIDVPIAVPEYTGVVRGGGEGYSGSYANTLHSSYEDFIAEAELSRQDAIDAYWAIVAITGLMALFGGLGYALRRKGGLIAMTAIGITCMIVAGVPLTMLYEGLQDNRDGFQEPGGLDDNAFFEEPGGTLETDGAGGWGPVAPPKATNMAAGGEGDSDTYRDTGSATAVGRPTVVRDYFPETWYWNPVLVTDGQGEAEVKLTAPDTITKWGIDAAASTKDARFGVGSANITVFQEFFVEPDLPVEVVRNDTFELRVMVYNYIDAPQAVKVDLQAAKWFETIGPSSKVVTLDVDEVLNATFTIRALEVGDQKITLIATSSVLTDVVIKDVRVAPDGKMYSDIQNGELRDTSTVTHTIVQSDDMIPGSANALVKIEGGLAGVAMDGAENYINFVSGCGEQATSGLLIDIVAYRNLQMSDADQRSLDYYEDIIVKGVQYEMQYVARTMNGRAIVYHPGEKPNTWLTAWGLYAFTDLEAAGFDVDPAIRKGLMEYLISTQEQDGSFRLYQTSHWSINDELINKDVASTAYMVRSLMYGGYIRDAKIDKAVDFIEMNIDLKDSALALGMALLALELAGGSQDMRTKLADELASRKIDGPSGSVYWDWSPTGKTRGHWYYDNSVETTAVVLMALAAHDDQAGLVAAAVKYLLIQRGRGIWGSTQSTAVAFQALNEEGKFGVDDMTITIDANGKRVRSMHLEKEDRDMLFYIDLRPYLDPSGSTDIVLSSTGMGTVLYQVIYEEHRPWSVYERAKDMPFEFEVVYDRTELDVGDWVMASVHVKYTGEAPQVQMVMVDLKAPTGLTFRSWYFQDLLYDGVIQQYDNYGSKVHLYIDNVDKGESIDFQVQLYAGRSATSTLQGTRAYDMYNPAIEAYAPPVTMTIN